MEVPWISLLSSLAAIAYLTGWLIRQLVALAALGKDLVVGPSKSRPHRSYEAARKEQPAGHNSYGWDGNIGWGSRRL